MNEAKKIIILFMTLTLSVSVVGCRKKENTKDNIVKDEVTVTELDKEEIVGSFNIGDEALINNGEYSIKILDMRKTEDRVPADTEPEEVVLVSMEYKNIKRKSSLVLPDKEFKVVDENGNAGKYYLMGERESIHVPKGSKKFMTIAFAFDKKVDSLILKNIYLDDNDEKVVEFKIPKKSKAVKRDYSGTMPNYEDVKKIGEEIDIMTNEGSMKLKIDSIEKTNERSVYTDVDPKAVYTVKYSYENVNIPRDIKIDSSNFDIIDENGNIGFRYPNTGKIKDGANLAQRGKWAKGEFNIATFIDSDKVMLSFTVFDAGIDDAISSQSFIINEKIKD